MAAPNVAALNDSQMKELGPWSNSAGEQWRHCYNYYAALLSLLIFVVVFGNVLMCMAVSRERALQTTTNYLIVSLAVADLLVAMLMMPWVAYLEVVGEWRFSWVHCDIFMTLDVILCTASILSLCAISIDSTQRLPCQCSTIPKRRVTLITMIWVLSSAISCLLLFGLKSHPESEEAHFVGPPERSRPTGTPLAFQLGITSGSCLMAGKWKAPSSIEVSVDTECDGQARFFRQSAECVGRETGASGQISSESKLSHQKEKKATHVGGCLRLAGVLIICWLPFLITHILNVHCQTCYIPPALYSACAWLGYIINPIIYTTFNVEFRKAFMKILHR
ncbi:D(2) dopamine receptor-like [Cetorhinus maximus]